MPGDHSKSFDGPGDNTPYVPTWIEAPMSDNQLLVHMTSIGGEYQGRRLHKIVELADGTFEANVMEGMQLVGDFGYDKSVSVAVRKALLASGCTF